VHGWRTVGLNGSLQARESRSMRRRERRSHGPCMSHPWWPASAPAECPVDNWGAQRALRGVRTRRIDGARKMAVHGRRRARHRPSSSSPGRPLRRGARHRRRSIPAARRRLRLPRSRMWWRMWPVCRAGGSNAAARWAARIARRDEGWMPRFTAYRKLLWGTSCFTVDGARRSAATVDCSPLHS
jgi:hypothetical protein